VRRVPTPPCPASLLPQGSNGAKEQADAIAHFTAENRAPNATFAFRAYREEDVSRALLEAFEYVCAYCESPTGRIEVEHYRPKNAVRTDAGLLPGYYWLAATWENLLPSCHDCNQDLWSVDPAGPRYKSGKGNWFPLDNEHARATGVGEETREFPLLLHPYIDEPAEHLEFSDDGIVQARKDANGVPSPRGDATIRILGLNRYGLPNARKAKLILVQRAFEDLLTAQREWQIHQDEESAENHHRRLAELQEHLERPGGYFAVAGQVLGLAGPRTPGDDVGATL
jgi:uncharacterized protein (TIGR02646 family)